MIEARTNVVYRPGFTTSFTVGKPGTTETAEPVAEVGEPWSPDGFIGSLVVVPESGDDATVTLKVVLGVRRGARECAPPAYEGCIVARRRVRYSPHDRLRVPVTLYAHCEGIPCTADTTCNHLGACVADLIEPTTCESRGGCSIAGDRPNEAPSRVDVSDGGPIANTDAGADASVDGSPTSDGGVEGGGESDGGLPGRVYCPPVGYCPVGAECCIVTSSPGHCVTPPEKCPLSEATVRCDSKEDCPIAGEICCALAQDVRCRASASCQGGAELCALDNICSVGSCTGPRYVGIYATCRPP